MYSRNGVALSSQQFTKTATHGFIFRTWESLEALSGEEGGERERENREGEGD
jgi:hypothetical protein